MPALSEQYRGKFSVDGPSRTEQLSELAVFLLLIVPSMVFSFFAIKTGTLSFLMTASAVILRDIGLVALILFFLWRNGEPRERIGLSIRDGWSEVALGVALYGVLFVGAGILEELLRMAGFAPPSTRLPSFLTARGTVELIVALVLVAVVAVAEETVFRGYLIHRIWAVTGSRGAAVILSSFVFAMGHGYEGTTGLVTVGAMGVFFAGTYLWRGSLTAPITMHFLHDFIGIVLVPLWRAHS